MICQPIRVLKIRRAIHVRIIGTEFVPKTFIIDGLDKSLLQLDKAIEKRLRNILSTKIAKPRGQFLIRQDVN